MPWRYCGLCRGGQPQRPAVGRSATEKSLRSCSCNSGSGLRLKRCTRRRPSLGWRPMRPTVGKRNQLSHYRTCRTTLGKHQLGLYVLAYSVVVVLLEVQNSLIASAYTVTYPRLDRLALARYTANALNLSVGLSALATMVLLGASAILPGGLDVRNSDK